MRFKRVESGGILRGAGGAESRALAAAATPFPGTERTSRWMGLGPRGVGGLGAGCHTGRFSELNGGPATRESALLGAMEREHLLTLVDHQKSFKGTREIYRNGEQH